MQNTHAHLPIQAQKLRELWNNSIEVQNQFPGRGYVGLVWYARARPDDPMFAGFNLPNSKHGLWQCIIADAEGSLPKAARIEKQTPSVIRSSSGPGLSQRVR